MGKSILFQERKGLPIYGAKNTIVNAIRDNETVIVVGETGSGKTTQIPQYIIENNICNRVAVSQPRRVAAVSIAKRVAEEFGCELGDKVGYSVRFDPKYSDSTVIKYVTDGMLLREAISDPLLLRYGCIVLDEVHDRTARTDVVLGLLKNIQRQRQKGGNKNPLKFVIMSATLNAQKFQQFFTRNGTMPPVLYVEGRLHPITLMYTAEPQTDYFDAAMRTVLQIHTDEKTYGSGDILTILTGQEEIESMRGLIEELSSSLPKGQAKLWPVPLYANLSLQDQALAFSKTPENVRKVVLATNIAETSVTIPNIKFVIDTGVVKVKTTFAKIGLTSLAVTDISKAMARQRMGRAGREGPGVCFRLYTEDSFFALKDELDPEIVRTPLTSIVLQLKAIGIDKVQLFDFVDRPSEFGLVQALEELYGIGALDRSGKLTCSGKSMARLPIEPIYAKMILEACKPEHDCVREVATIVAMLSVEGVLFKFSAQQDSFDDQKQAIMNKKRIFGNLSEVGRVESTTNGTFNDAYTPVGDHLLLLNVFNELEKAIDEFNTQLASSKSVMFTETGENVNRQTLKQYIVEWCKDHGLNYSSLKQALEIRNQIAELLQQMRLCESTRFDKNYSDTAVSSTPLSDRVLCCLFTGLVNKLAFLGRDGSYKTAVGHQIVYIHPSSLLFNPSATNSKSKATLGLPKIVMYGELIFTTKHYMRNVSAVQSAWLTSSASHVFGV